MSDRVPIADLLAVPGATPGPCKVTGRFLRATEATDAFGDGETIAVAAYGAETLDVSRANAREFALAWNLKPFQDRLASAAEEYEGHVYAGSLDQIESRVAMFAALGALREAAEREVAK